MSTGLTAAARRISAIITATVPKSEPRRTFRSVDDMRGQVLPLDEAPAGDDRLFELALGLPEDGGEVGAPPLRQRVVGRVRIRYRRVGSQLQRAARQAEDVERIRRALHTPIDWQSPSTGIDAVICVEAPDRVQVLRPDLDAAAFEVIEIPITIIYREGA